MIDLRVADVFDFLGGIESKTVDLVFADSPFNLGFDYDLHNDDMPDEEYMAWCYRWLDESCRVLKPTGSLFVLNIPKHGMRFGSHLMAFGMHFQHWIAWEAGSRPASQKPIMPTHYSLLWFTKSPNEFTVNEVRGRHQRCRHCGGLVKDYGGHANRMHPIGPQISDVWTDIARAKHLERGPHPCTLPKKLLDRIITLATNPGDLVVDPFLGAGTTAMICKLQHRDCLAADISPDYVALAQRRVDSITPRLFLDDHEPVMFFESEDGGYE